jgi:hypothetical protein
MRWHLSHRASKAGVKIADRHYSRQKPGSPQFVKPGRCLVLKMPADNALWVTSWPYPQFVKHAWAGAWENALFRNESVDVASELILEAVAATRAYYGGPPPLGMVTMINPLKVRPFVRGGLPSFGWCYRKAGFRYVGQTQEGKLVFQLLPADMPTACPPHGMTVSMFAGLEAPP